MAVTRLAAAAVVGLTGAAAVAGPAQADPPARRQASSAIDLLPDKSAVVRCPDRTVVLGAGGQTNGGGGNVLLTAIVPDPTLSTVRVSAHAVGALGPWSVTAYAVCAPADLVHAQRVQGLSTGWAASTGCLDPGHVLYGIGFEAAGGDGTARLDALVPNEDQNQVAVHVSGATPPAALAVYGICAGFFGGHQRCQRVGGVGASVPTGCFPRFGDGLVFGAGGLVSGGGNLHLDALVPSPAPNTDGSVRAQRLTVIMGVAGAARIASTGGEDATVRAFGDLIGSWY